LKIETTRFGTLEINPEDLITFPEGVLGFSQLDQFLLLDHKTGPFRWLQAATDPEVAFVVLDLGLVVEDYELRLGEGDLETLGLESCEEEDALAILAIINVTTPRSPTANLLAPICISTETRRGIQVVQHHTGYSTRYPLTAGEEGRKVA
jgi:flagellar assembly factor FliW